MRKSGLGWPGIKPADGRLRQVCAQNQRPLLKKLDAARAKIV
jgi:hypothetical protein